MTPIFILCELAKHLSDGRNWYVLSFVLASAGINYCDNKLSVLTNTELRAYKVGLELVFFCIIKELHQSSALVNYNQVLEIFHFTNKTSLISRIPSAKRSLWLNSCVTSQLNRNKVNNLIDKSSERLKSKNNGKISNPLIIVCDVLVRMITY